LTSRGGIGFFGFKRETETEVGLIFRFFLVAVNVHHHGIPGEPEI
jgi:hypothetical protein